MLKNRKLIVLTVMLFIFVFGGNTVKASEISVSNWDEFTKALANPDVSTMKITNSFANPTPSTSVATATAGTLDRSLKIIGATSDGSKPVIDFGNTATRVAPGITLMTNPTKKSVLELDNIEFKGSESVSNANAPNAAMIKSDDKGFNWTIKISGFSYNKGNTKRFLYGPTVAVVFDGEETVFDNDYGTSSATSTAGMASIGTDMSRLIEAFSVDVTNRTKLSVNTRDLFFYTNYNSATSLEQGPGFYVEKGSTFIGNNVTVPIIAAEGNYFKLYVEGDPNNPNDSSMASTAEIYGETKRRTDMGGVIAVKGTNAHFKVDNQSTLNVHSRWSVAILMQSQYGIFDVDNQSKLEVEQDSDNGYTLGAAIRFRWEGDMTFNIKGQSQLNVIKRDINANGEPATANRAGAVRMYQTGNQINVTEGGQFLIESDSNESVIDFDGNDTQFNLLDENSRVVMKSKRSAGMSGSRAHVVAGPGTEFQVTAGGTGSAFGLAAGSVLEFDNMLYYDFTQTNKRAVMGTASSILNSINSDTSIWKTTSRIDGNPDKAWTLVNYGASGAYFGTLNNTFTISKLPDKIGQVFTTDPTVKTVLTTSPTRIRDLSRISGNNAKPIVDELRIPTDADKFIFGHVSVPEGVVDSRDAWTDEVTVAVKVKKTDGTSYELLGKTIGLDDTSDGLSVYGEKARAGMFVIENKDGAFFKEGDTVEVLRAWRGGAGGETNPSPDKTHIGYPTDNDKWVKNPVSAIDVTPPNKVKTEVKLTNATKQISGTSDENNSKVFIKRNDEWLLDAVGQPVSTTVTEGKWTINLPEYVEKNDKLDIYIKDSSILSKDIPYDLPTTYTQEPNGEWGNISVNVDGYDSFKGYHDAVNSDSADYRFNSALRLQAEDILPDKPQLVKTFESDSSEGIQVGDTLTYKINVKNNKESSFNTIWKKVVVTDVLPEGLLFDKATANMKINNLAIPETDYSFDESTRTLTIPVGNLNSQESSVISFNTKLGSSTVGKVITNKAKAIGNSPREKDFVVGPEDDKNERATYSAEGEVSTTEVYGVIELVSAPKTINFGIVSYDATVKRVDNGIYDQDLIVNDTRARKSKWTLGAKLISQMTNTDDESIKLVDSLQYVNGDKTVILSEDLQGIYQSADKPAEDETVINISDTWGSTKDSNGIKLVIDPTKSKITNGQYTGEIEWQLMEATP